MGRLRLSTLVRAQDGYLASFSGTITQELHRNEKWLRQHTVQAFVLIGVLEWIRTTGLRIRNPLLYPAELRGRIRREASGSSILEQPNGLPIAKNNPL